MTEAAAGRRLWSRYFWRQFFTFSKKDIVKSAGKWYIIYNDASNTRDEEREGYTMSKKEIINKLDDILENSGVNGLIGRKKEEEKKSNTLLWVLAIIGAVAAVAAIAYAVYRYLTPDYLEDFEDDFDDDFEDDFFEDEDDDETSKEKEEKK